MPDEDASHEPPLPRLSRPLFWGIFAIALCIFLFATGPVWRHPWDVAFDFAVYYSYAPIPFLVLAAAAYQRWRRRRAGAAAGAGGPSGGRDAPARDRFGVRAFVLDTMELTFLKYATTLAIAIALWMTQSAPPPVAAAPARAPAPPAPSEPAPAPTPIRIEDTGTLTGVVRDASGKPVAGALVFVASGLEAYVFAAPAEPLRLENDGHGATPRLAAAQTGQTILARSTDGHLHSLVASRGEPGRAAADGEGAEHEGGRSRDEGALFHIPMLSSGAWSTVVVREPHGVASLSCTVHQGSTSEAAAHLAVFAHPFFALTGDDGRFRFAGVPRGRVGVGAWRGPDDQASVETTVDAGATRVITVALPQS